MDYLAYKQNMSTNTKGEHASFYGEIADPLLERFLRYVSIDTQSAEESDTYPSTSKQYNLLNLLYEELKAMGAENVRLDAYGYVTASLPATAGCESAPAIGLLAHVDTSPDMSGEHVRAQLVESYDGGDIPLGHGYVLKPSEFPELNALMGHTLITTDGSTLLGADNKAGVAEIMTLCAYLQRHPEIPHGKICIGFTPDEEVGRGVDHFDVKSFGADFAYTIDGGVEGELEFENFNAASVRILVQGRNVHPGYAKGKMVNALECLHAIHQALPQEARPELTQGYEGFYHLTSMKGDVERAESHYIIRDHDRDQFEQKKEQMRSSVDAVNQHYGREVASLEVHDQYYNMRQQVEPYPQLIELAEQAMQSIGVKPLIRPIRGGTDGARLSYMGLPCPNIFTGGANFHSRYEYASFTTMQRAVHTLLKLVELWSTQRK